MRSRIWRSAFWAAAIALATFRPAIGIQGRAFEAERTSRAEPGAPASEEKIRLGVCDWTIEKSGDPGAFGLAAKLGLAGVQASLAIKDDVVALTRPEVRRLLLEASERSGVALVSFAIGVLNDVPLKSDPRAAKWLEQGIEVCKATGAKRILVPFFGKGELRNDPPGIETVIAILKKIAPAAEKAGVVLALESYLSAEDHIRILDRVGSPAVRVYYDVGNSQDAGYDIVKEIRLLGNRICEFHAKDTRDLYGKGSMDFRAVKMAMDDIGYAGWLVIEGTKLPLGVEKSIRYDADFLRSVF
jgi:sugar phosphate isomerase/epimerase